MIDIWEEKYIFSPSLICLDMCNLESQIRLIEKSGIGMLHIDILDGYFSPSMPLGFETVGQLRKITKLKFDCHVMTKIPDYFIDELLDIGAEQIVFHMENVEHIDRLLQKIRNHGVRTGIALKPASSLHGLEYIMKYCDTILLMLINPGYAGNQSENQVLYAQRKINDLYHMIQSRDLKTKIEIDGRVSKDNIINFGEAFIDIFVVGSTCLDKTNLEKSLIELMELRRVLSAK